MSMLRSLFVVTAVAVLFSSPAVAQKGAMKTGEVKPEGGDAVPKLTGRLPMYYSSAANVSREQRQSIYKLQAEYDEEIETLLQEIEDVRAERDEKIQAVLTPEQREKVAAAKKAAREKRAARRAAKK